MKEKSIWRVGFPKRSCPKLDKDIDVDVLIIGGGITGINTAYQLLDSKLKVCLVEKNTIGDGVTSRTTGKLTYLQEDIYSKLSTYVGKEKAKLYLQSQKDAIKLVTDIIKKEGISCNLEKNNSYVFTDNKKTKLEKEKETLLEFGIDVKDAKELPNGEKTDAIYVDDTYVFHALKYIYGLKDICVDKGIQMYEDTKIISMDKTEDGYVCKTKENSIKTKHVVLALHYPYFLFPFFMPLKAHLEKSYIEAFRVEKNYEYNAITVSKPTISIRYYSDNDKHYEIYLTNSHDLSVKHNEKENFKDLMKAKEKHPEYMWSNKDIMTMDSLPYIGSLNDDNTLLIGTGYNTWGMTNGSFAGKILSDIIQNKENKYIELFNPKRGLNLGKVMNFPIVLGANVYSFTKTKLKKNKAWYFSNVRFEDRDGKKVGIYVDENKKEHIVYNICPHLKCSLIFNEIEKTWDCPCHGSRFDIDGKCIEGPSNYNITYEE